MLDEMIKKNASKFAVILVYEKSCRIISLYLKFPLIIALVYCLSLDRKFKVDPYTKIPANFETFPNVISSSINLLILKRFELHTAAYEII